MLSIGFPDLQIPPAYKPEVIRYHSEMEFFIMLYETIFYFGDKGEVLSNVLQDFYWKEGFLHLDFKSNLLTSLNESWGAEDAYLSLLRLIILDKNTHGHLKSFLCPNEKPSHFRQGCSGLELNGNSLLLNIRKGQVKTFIELLSTHELSIIPKSSIDHINMDLKNFSNTTGRFYVDKVYSKEKSISLSVNENHPLAQSLNYSKVILKGLYPGDLQGYSTFKNHNLDILPTYSSLEGSKLLEIGIENKNLNYHKSVPINLYALKFSPYSKALTERRLKIYKKIRTYYKKHIFIKDFHHPTNQLFSDLGELSLNQEQIKSFKQKLDDINEQNEMGEGINFKIRSKNQRNQEIVNIIQKILPKINIIEDNSFLFTPEDNCDFTIISTDTGLHEHYSLIAYFAASQTFQFKSKKEEEDWFEKYANEENKEVRLSMAKEKHFESLMNAYALPIFLSPYVALAKKPWKLDLPKIYAGTPLWRIYRD